MSFNTTKVREKIIDIIRKDRLPNVSICVQGPNGIVFSEGFGKRNEEGDIVDTDTVFGIASMSKSITSLCICMLAVEGKLSLDDPVTRFLPDFHVPGTPSSLVTIRTLANHTSGIPPMEPLEWSIAMNSHRRDTPWLKAMRESAPNKMETINQLLEYIRNCPYPTVGAPGENMSYSNEGYAILSYIVDVASGMPLEDFCEKRIFRPLGMTRTVMDVDGQKAEQLAKGNIASLYEYDDNNNLLCDRDWSILPPFRGSAMVKSTAKDMASYYHCLSCLGVSEGRQIIPQEAILMMIGPSVPLRREAVYGLGLYKREFNGHVICEHSGGLHGVSTKGGLFLEEGYGFAVLCSLGDADMDEIMWCLYNAVIGLPLNTGHRWFVPRDQLFSDPKTLSGTYIGHEGIPETCTVSDDGIHAVLAGQICDLVWCGGTRFLAVDPSDHDCLRGRLEFFYHSGYAWAVRVGSRIFTAQTPTHGI